jgi:ATP-binding cassette subfamily B protein
MYRDADDLDPRRADRVARSRSGGGDLRRAEEKPAGRIGIVISHRFSTVRIADRIAVIADGHISELGTHEDLLRAGGRYARLFDLQAAGYR